MTAVLTGSSMFATGSLTSAGAGRDLFCTSPSRRATTNQRSNFRKVTQKQRVKWSSFQKQIGRPDVHTHTGNSHAPLPPSISLDATAFVLDGGKSTFDAGHAGNLITEWWVKNKSSIAAAVSGTVEPSLRQLGLRTRERRLAQSLVDLVVDAAQPLAQCWPRTNGFSESNAAILPPAVLAFALVLLSQGFGARVARVDVRQGSEEREHGALLLRGRVFGEVGGSRV